MQRVLLPCACLGFVLMAVAPALAGPAYTVFSDPSGGAGSTLQFGLNNAGEYVGSYLSGGVYYGFMNNTVDFSPVKPPDGAGYHPTGINNVNGIVGYYQDPAGTHGFVDQGGSYSTLNIAGATRTYAYGTNDHGLVVGYYVGADGKTHGFSETGGVSTTIDVPGALSTYILGVNNSGEMVGSYYDGTETHAFLYSGGNVTTIDYPDAPYTFASSINNHGDIVGWYATCIDCPQIGFLLDSGGNYTAIAPIQGVATYLTGINDSDQIMISMLGTNLDIRGLIGGPPNGLPPVSPIPEPGTHVLMATGGLLVFALGGLRRRRS